MGMIQNEDFRSRITALESISKEVIQIRSTRLSKWTAKMGGPNRSGGEFFA
jgi:hypothetical protein